MSDDINTISTNNISETQSLTCGANLVNMGGLSTPVTTPEPKSTSNPSGSRSEIHYPGVQNPSRIYDSKKNRKIVRIMTVMGYMFAVSLAAIVLSLYYAFLWNPNMQTNNSTNNSTNSVKTNADTTPVPSVDDNSGVTLFDSTAQNQFQKDFESTVSSQPLSESKTQLNSTVVTNGPAFRSLTNKTNVENISNILLQTEGKKEDVLKLIANPYDMNPISSVKLNQRISNNKNIRREEILDESNRTEINIIDNRIEISLNTNTTSTQETIRNNSNSGDH